MSARRSQLEAERTSLVKARIDAFDPRGRASSMTTSRR